MPLSNVQIQRIHDSIDDRSRCIMEDARGHFYPGTPAYRDVLQLAILAEYIHTHFVEDLSTSHLFCE